MIDEHMEYFVKRRISDPGYTAKEALGDYFAYQPMEAIDIVFNYVSDCPFDFETLESYIQEQYGCEAF